MSPRYYFPSFSIGRAKSAEAEFVETHIEKAPMYSTCFFTLWPIEMSFTKAPSSVGAEEMSFCEQTNNIQILWWSIYSQVPFTTVYTHAARSSHGTACGQNVCVVPWPTTNLRVKPEPSSFPRKKNISRLFAREVPVEHGNYNMYLGPIRRWGTKRTGKHFLAWHISLSLVCTSRLYKNLTHHY